MREEQEDWEVALIKHGYRVFAEPDPTIIARINELEKAGKVKTSIYGCNSLKVEYLREDT